MPRNSVRKYRNTSPRSPIELLDDNQQAIETLLTRLEHLHDERARLWEIFKRWGSASTDTVQDNMSASRASFLAGE